MRSDYIKLRKIQWFAEDNPWIAFMFLVGLAIGAAVVYLAVK